jgi:hypothetical protein
MGIITITSTTLMVKSLVNVVNTLLRVDFKLLYLDIEPLLNKE